MRGPQWESSNQRKVCFFGFIEIDFLCTAPPHHRRSRLSWHKTTFSGKLTTVIFCLHREQTNASLQRLATKPTCCQSFYKMTPDAQYEMTCESRLFTQNCCPHRPAKHLRQTPYRQTCRRTSDVCLPSCSELHRRTGPCHRRFPTNCHRPEIQQKRIIVFTGLFSIYPGYPVWSKVDPVCGPPTLLTTSDITLELNF